VDVFTDKDLYVIKHKTKTELILDTECHYYLTRHADGGGIFKDMNYTFPRLSLTRYKMKKSNLLTFETEEAAIQYLQEHKDTPILTSWKLY